jgi:hypothetical protein
MPEEEFTFFAFCSGRHVLPAAVRVPGLQPNAPRANAAESTRILCARRKTLLRREVYEGKVVGVQILDLQNPRQLPPKKPLNSLLFLARKPKKAGNSTGAALESVSEMLAPVDEKLRQLTRHHIDEIMMKRPIRHQKQELSLRKPD